MSAVSQGVTLEVVGNCGYGCAPIVDPGLAREAIYGFRDDLPLGWRSVAGYLERLEAARPAVNVMTLVPNGQLRLGVVGPVARAAHRDELGRMKRLLREGLEEGAFGYSTGLEYAAEVGASEEEVTELCREVARAGGLYATHTRNRDEAAVEAVAEAVRTAEAAGCGSRSRTSLRGAGARTPSGASISSRRPARGAPTPPSTCTRGSSARPISR